MSKANGVVDLDVGKRSFELKIGMWEFSRIEDDLGYGIFGMAQKARQNVIEIRDLIALIYWGLRSDQVENNGITKSELTKKEVADYLEQAVSERGMGEVLDDLFKAIEDWLPDEDEIDEADIKNEMGMHPAQRPSGPSTARR